MQSLWKSLIPGARSSAEDDLLSAIPLFEKLTSRELDAVQRLLHRRQYVAGESIFLQGEPGLGMYIIARGGVSIQIEPSGRELVALCDGHFFGEIALLNEVTRSASARAATDCTLLSLFQPDLLGLLDRNPRLGVKILVALARLVGLRLVDVNDEMEALSRECTTLKAEVERLGGTAASGAGETRADAGRLE